jgi:uncharacterized OsmC-like protein
MSTAEESRLNDVDFDSVVGLAGKIQEEPEVADTKWNAHVKWKGGFRSEASIRDFQPIMSDEPPDLGGSNKGPNPVEQVLAALGNCLAVGYAANATAAGIEIRSLSIDIEGDLDLHTFLGLTEGNAGYSDISVKVNIDSNASKTDLEAVHNKVINTSPVGHTLSRAVPVKIELS